AAERPEHELVPDAPVESGPVEIGHELPDERGEIGHVGDAVGLARGQRVGGVEQLAVEFGLGPGRVGGEIVHRGSLAALAVAAKPAMAYLITDEDPEEARYRPRRRGRRSGRRRLVDRPRRPGGLYRRRGERNRSDHRRARPAVDSDSWR